MARIQYLFDLQNALARRQSLPRAAGGTAALARARMAAQAKQSAPAQLRPLLAPLTPLELMRLRQLVLTTPALTLDLLPPLVVAKIRLAQGRALLDMLLAWGKALREQAAIAKKAQERARQKAYEAGRKLVAQEQKAVAAQARQVAAAWLQPAAPLEARELAFTDRGPWGRSLSRNTPALGALALPLRTGVSLRTPVLRLPGHG